MEKKNGEKGGNGASFEVDEDPLQDVPLLVHSDPLFATILLPSKENI